MPGKYSKDTKIQLVRQEIELLKKQKKFFTKYGFSHYLMKKYPLQFTSYDSAYGAVKCATGSNGARSRTWSTPPSQMYKKPKK